MKITDVEVYVVDPTGGAATYNDEPQNVWTFVRVLTDAGVHGWGESTNFPANGSLIIADAIRHLRPWIVGQDASDITAMWHRLFRKATYLGPRGLPTAVVSGIDIALWDIKGKATGRPVYDLLGGKVRESVPLYANGWFAALDGHPAAETPEDYAAAARRVVARGHTAIKLDPFLEMIPLPHRLPRGADHGRGRGLRRGLRRGDSRGRRSAGRDPDRRPRPLQRAHRGPASPGDSSRTASAGSRSRRRPRASRRSGRCGSRSRSRSASASGCTPAGTSCRCSRSGWPTT